MIIGLNQTARREGRRAGKHAAEVGIVLHRVAPAPRPHVPRQKRLGCYSVLPSFPYSHFLMFQHFTDQNMQAQLPRITLGLSLNRDNPGLSILQLTRRSRLKCALFYTKMAQNWAVQLHLTSLTAVQSNH